MIDIRHRGISIRHYEVPGSPVYWSDDQSNIGGIAADADEARQQIDAAICVRGSYCGWTIERLHGGDYEARGRAILSGPLAHVLDQIDNMMTHEVCP